MKVFFLNIEIFILRSFPRKSLILNSSKILFLLLKRPFLKMKDVYACLLSIYAIEFEKFITHDF